MNEFSHIADGNFHLTPKNEKYPRTEQLKRSEIDGLDASQWDELCIAASENEQSNQISSLLKDDEFMQAVNTYKSLKLSPATTLRYPNKHALKKGSQKIGIWIGIAAAITILVAAQFIISKYPTQAYEIAITPNPPNNAQQKKQADDTATTTTPVIAQTIEEKKQTSEKLTARSHTKNKAIESSSIATEEVRSASTGLAAIEPIPRNNRIATNIQAGLVEQCVHQTMNTDSILLVSAEGFRRIEVEKPNFFDRLREKSIVNINKLLGEGTMVVREFDDDGKITLYAVQSNTLNFEKNYIK